MSGKVYLVGAGPGDPELLTLKAVRVLGKANAVLHDDLVSQEVLRLIPKGAQIHNVGKRCGENNTSQQEINFLMVTLASSGMQVVRLKGGDPLVFGRIAEEISALKQAAIPYEIIPGISAAFGAAASAQFPLTDRKSAHALVLVTGHLASETDTTNWRALVSMGATFAIYMPGREYAALGRKLTASGLSDTTPCAIISRATTAHETVHITTLKQLRNAPRLQAPTILIVGEIVRHASAQNEPDEFAAWLKAKASISIPASVDADFHLRTKEESRI